MIAVYNKDKKIIMSCNSFDPIKAYIEDNEFEYIESDEEIDFLNFEYSCIDGEITKGNALPKPEPLENK